MSVRRRDILVGAAFLVGGLFLAAASLAFVRFDKGGVEQKVDGRTIIRFAAWGAKEETQELRERVVARVNAEAADFLIKLEPVPRDYPMKLATMIAGGYAPDVFYLDPAYLACYAEMGALMDLTDLVERDESPVCDLPDYYPSILQAYHWRGRLWALPWIAQPVVLYCNVGLFEKSGLALPDKTWDWHAFADAAERISGRGAEGSLPSWGFVMDEGWPPFEMLVWQNGGAIIGGDGRVHLAERPALEAADFVQRLVGSGAAAPLSSARTRGISNLFRDGRVGMFMGGAADDLDRIGGLHVVVSELPKGPGGLRSTYAWNAGLCISASTRHPEIAFRAWKALLDAVQHWKIAPPRRSMKGLIETIEPRKAGAADAIRRSMEYMRPMPLIREQKAFRSILGLHFKEPLVRLEADAETLAKKVQPLLEELAR